MKSRKVKQAVPKYILAAQVFGPIFKLLADIENGEVNEVEGHVVIDRNNAIPEIKHMLLSAPTYLLLMCEAYKHIGIAANAETKTDALCKVAKILKGDELVFTDKLLKDARAELAAFRTLWSTQPVHIIKRSLDAFNTEQEYLATKVEPEEVHVYEVTELKAA